MHAALEQISGEAPVKAPPNRPAYYDFSPNDEEIISEAFHDGVTWGLWLAAKIAREALANAGENDNG